MSNLEEMEQDQKKKQKKQKQKKRGRREEEQEDFRCNNLQDQTKKQETVEHCTDYYRSVWGESESKSSEEHNNNFISSTGFGIFDFPWMHEGTVSRSEDWDYVEDTFSSSLEDSCFRSRLKFFDASCSCTSETGPPAAGLTNFDDKPPVSKEICSDDGHGLEMDCIWNSLLNQPLQVQQGPK